MIAPKKETKKVCCVSGCGEVRVDYGVKTRCIMHERIRQMIKAAKEAHKYTPSMQELEDLFWGAKNMMCKHCGKKMKMRAGKDGRRGCVITLQHNKDGSLDLICQSCNTKEGHTKHDKAFSMPKGKYVCSQCCDMKDIHMFAKCATNHKGHSSVCKQCVKIYYRNNQETIRAQKKEYNRANRTTINAKARARRAAKKVAQVGADTCL